MMDKLELPDEIVDALEKRMKVELVGLLFAGFFSGASAFLVLAAVLIGDAMLASFGLVVIAVWGYTATGTFQRLSDYSAFREDGPDG